MKGIETVIEEEVEAENVIATDPHYLHPVMTMKGKEENVEREMKRKRKEKKKGKGLDLVHRKNLLRDQRLLRNTVLEYLNSHLICKYKNIER